MVIFLEISKTLNSSEVRIHIGKKFFEQGSHFSDLSIISYLVQIHCRRYDQSVKICKNVNQ